MLLLSNSYAFTEALTSHSLEVLSFGYGLTFEVYWTVIGVYLTYLHNFSAIILKKYFFIDRSSTLPPWVYYVLYNQHVR